MPGQMQYDDASVPATLAPAEGNLKPSLFRRALAPFVGARPEDSKVGRLRLPFGWVLLGLAVVSAAGWYTIFKLFF